MSKRRATEVEVVYLYLIHRLISHDFCNVKKIFPCRPRKEVAQTFSGWECQVQEAPTGPSMVPPLSPTTLPSSTARATECSTKMKFFR